MQSKFAFLWWLDRLCSSILRLCSKVHVVVSIVLQFQILRFSYKVHLHLPVLCSRSFFPSSFASVQKLVENMSSGYWWVYPLFSISTPDRCLYKTVDCRWVATAMIAPPGQRLPFYFSRFPIILIPSSVALLYDHLLTLGLFTILLCHPNLYLWISCPDMEAQYIWNQPKRRSSYFFLVLRYLVTCGEIVVLGLRFHPPPSNPNVCSLLIFLDLLDGFSDIDTIYPSFRCELIVSHILETKFW